MKQDLPAYIFKKPKKKHKPGVAPYEGPPLGYDSWLPFAPIFKEPFITKEDKYSRVRKRLQA